MSEEVTPLELQYEAINKPTSMEPEYESQVSDARREVDTILAAGAINNTPLETEPETSVENAPAATQEAEPKFETLTPLQIGINIEAVRRAELADAA